MRRLIIDSCFWFALFDVKDQYHNKADEMAKFFDNPEVKILVPFPSMYETLNTSFVDDKKQLERFSDILNSHERIEFVNDDDYKDSAFSKTISQKKDTKVSLVDYIILEMLADSSLAIDGVVTFNERDFSEACRNLEKEMVCYSIA